MEIVEDLFSNSRLLMKWCINFLAALMWHGNGQRTQVFTFLKAPTEDQLESFCCSSGEQSGVPFQILIDEREKRQRNIHLNSIMVTPSIFNFIEFHTRYVLRHLHKKFDIPPGDVRRKFLLLHSSTGYLMKTNNIRASLSSFCNSIDDSLHVTPTMLRAAYASFMVHKYVRGTKDGILEFNQQPQEFIETLANVMNTSVAMIKRFTRLQQLLITQPHLLSVRYCRPRKLQEH